ncbi:hypothetical protein LENED_012889 [Lentinula edodes]|nr:hypothetical protein LENED_012889 [Lentinula edodes]
MTKPKAKDDVEREQLSLASFLLITLLLPSLLTAPTERDIRIINVVNRFYAAASASSFSSAFYDSLTSDKTPPLNSTFLAEGTRSLRTIILTRHLQRILDALPAAQIPKTDSNSSAIPVVNSDSQKSNIVAITVSPGISRADTVARILNADWTSTDGYSIMGVFLYLLALPLLHVCTKSSVAAVQSVLHVLFLPTPFKFLSQTIQNQPKAKNDSLIDKSVTESPEEVLKPGALYAECAVVRLKVPSPPLEGVADGNRNDKGNGNGKAAEKEPQTLDLPDDGEFGGELAGRRRERQKQPLNKKSLMQRRSLHECYYIHILDVVQSIGTVSKKKIMMGDSRRGPSKIEVDATRIHSGPMIYLVFSESALSG